MKKCRANELLLIFDCKGTKIIAQAKGENMTDTELENIIQERLNSPRQYGLDGEQVTNDSVKDLAQLIALYKSVKSKKRSTSLRISVCKGNGTV